jgi:hypothetical protein
VTATPDIPIPPPGPGPEECARGALAHLKLAALYATGAGWNLCKFGSRALAAYHEVAPASIDRAAQINRAQAALKEVDTP